MTRGETRGERSWLWSRSGLVLLGFLIIGAFFVVTEHMAHVLGVLPYLLVLACPLLHLFHGGHGRGHGRHAGGGAHEGHDEHAARDDQGAGHPRRDVGNR